MYGGSYTGEHSWKKSSWNFLNFSMGRISCLICSAIALVQDMGLLRTWDMFIEGMRRLFPIVMIRIAESAGWELPGHLRNG